MKVSYKNSCLVFTLVLAVMTGLFGFTFIHKADALTAPEIGHPVKVLLLEDTYWSNNANRELLTLAEADYDRMPAESFSSIDLAKYNVIIIGFNQSESAHTTLLTDESRQRLEDWVWNGGALLMGVSNYSQPGEVWPGGITITSSPQNLNYIADRNESNGALLQPHVIVSGDYSFHRSNYDFPTPLCNAMLYGCTISDYYLSNLPDSYYSIFAVGDAAGPPTLAEVKYGLGTIMYSCVNWEPAYVTQTNDYYGYAKESYDDLLIYTMICANRTPAPDLYNVKIASLTGGNILLEKYQFAENAVVEPSILPDTGWKLTYGSLQYDDGMKTVQIDPDERWFYMPAADITISALFEQIAYGISIASCDNGTITADATEAVLGTTVNLTISPNAGMQLADGSLKVNGTAIDGTSFTMPAADVTITAEFVAKPVSVAQITVNSSSIDNSVVAGETLQMSANILPDNASDKSVTWSVSNNTCQASIDADTGLLTAGSAGTVLVTATARDGSNVAGSLEITVMPAAVSQINVTAKNGAASVVVQQSLQMYAEVLPAAAADKSVTWSVVNGIGEATITSDGLLTGTRVGSVQVVATAHDGSNVVGSLDITIAPVPVAQINVTANNGTQSVGVSQSLQMCAEVLPADAGNKAVTWSVINNTGQASIDANGSLTGISPGEITVLATAQDGTNISGNCTINVVYANHVPVSSITVSGENGSANVGVNQSLQMTAQILPENATNKSVTWTVVNRNGRATISGTGLLTGTRAGYVTVVATANDGSGKWGVAEIRVGIPVTGITVTAYNNATSVIIGRQPLQMLASVTPKNATNSTVMWFVQAGTGSAAIDPSSGLLYGLTPGTVTVLATATDGSGIVGKTTINVAVPVQYINVTGQNGQTTVSVKQVMQMIAAVQPYNSSQNVTWSVKNGTGSAKISSTGLLSGIKEGMVTVIATASDGSGITGQISINVSKP